MDHIEQKKQQFCQALVDCMNADGHFASFSHVRLTDLSPDGTCTGVLDVAEDNLNYRGIVHGGALATLADTVAGTAVAAATGCSCVTVNYGFNFLRPAVGSQITCSARPEKLGKHICVMHADLFDGQNTKVAAGEFTFCVMEPLDQEAPYGRIRE
jgi:acyl-CoA thioesterase